MDVGGALKGENGADTTVFDCLVNEDDSLLNVTYLTFKRLRSLISNYNRHLEHKKWSERFQYVSKCD